MSQGTLYVKGKNKAGFIRVLVVPAENPEEWFLKVFPTDEAVHEYSILYGITISGEGNDETDREDG